MGLQISRENVTTFASLAFNNTQQQQQDKPPQ